MGTLFLDCETARRGTGLCRRLPAGRQPGAPRPDRDRPLPLVALSVLRRAGARRPGTHRRGDPLRGEQSLGLNDGPSDMARTCEEILLAAGRSEDAYRRFAYTANRAGSHLATFWAIK